MRVTFRLEHKEETAADIAAAIARTGKVLPPGEYRVVIEPVTKERTNEQNRFYIMLQAMALAMPAVNELLLGKQEEMRDILAERLEFRGSDPEKAKADADRMTFLLCSALTTPKGVQSAAARQMTADTLQELFPLG